MDTLDIATLNRRQFDSYVDALRSSHRIRCDVRIRNGNEKPVGSLTDNLLSGSVDVDASEDVTRSLDLTLLDPENKLRFEPDSPSFSAVYADRFVSVRYEVLVTGLEAWVSVPVFWGPVTKFDRSGGQVQLRASGKQVLMLDPYFATRGYTIHRRTRTDEAVKLVARRAGERRFALPDLDHRLARARTVTAREEPWKVIAGGLENREGKPVAGLIERGPKDRRAYYDPRGKLAVRRLTKRTAWTFAHGRDLTAPPQLSYGTDFINHVIVTGAKPKGKPAAHGEAQLQARHPLSPASLARNGEPTHRTVFVDTELATDRECRERAQETLERLSKGGVSATFEALPVPHLQEDDWVKLKTPDYALAFRLRKFTLPLVAESMSVNALKRVSDARRRHGGRMRSQVFRGGVR